MKLQKRFIIAVCATTIVVSSCVPAKEFQALQDKNVKCEEERERFSIENESLVKNNKELDSKYSILKAEVDQLIDDSTSRSIEINRLKDENQKLTNRYAELQELQESFMAGSQKESRRVLAELQSTHEELQLKQDALKELERQLNLRRKNL